MGWIIKLIQILTHYDNDSIRLWWVDGGQTVLVLAGILMFRLPPSSQCVPVEIGQNLQLFCTCQDRKSHVFWEIKSASGERVKINGCDGESNLILQGSLNLNVTYNQSNSMLTLAHVATEHTNHHIICFKDTRPPSSKDILKMCHLQVFHKPEMPYCFTEITGKGSARFVCSTSKVYPGLQCNIVYKRRHRAETAVRPEMIQYNLTAINPQHPSYMRGFCFVEISNLDPGEYQLFGVLRPNVTFVYNSSVAAGPTPLFVISNTSDDLPTTPTSLPTTPTSRNEAPPPLGYVAIHIQGLSLPPVCHDAVRSFTVFCEAHEFRSKPKLTLLLNYKHGEHDQKRVVQSVDNTSVINATFSVDAQHRDTMVRCLGDTPYGTASNQTELGVTWLQHIFIEARLVSNNEPIPNIIQVERNKLFVFTCRVNDEQNEIFISQMHVNCLSETNITLLDKLYSESYSKVQLNVARITDIIRCTCTGTHKNGCSVQRSNFEIEIKDPESIVLENKLTSDALIVVVVIACILTASILGLVFQFSRYRKRTGQFCGSNSPSESHIYEEVSGGNCQTFCLNFCTPKRSGHTCTSGVMVKCQGQEETTHHTVTSLLGRSGPRLPAEDVEDRQENDVNRCSPYENWSIT